MLKFRQANVGIPYREVQEKRNFAQFETTSSIARGLALSARKPDSKGMPINNCASAALSLVHKRLARTLCTQISFDDFVVIQQIGAWSRERDFAVLHHISIMSDLEGLARILLDQKNR